MQCPVYFTWSPSKMIWGTQLHYRDHLTVLSEKRDRSFNHKPSKQENINWKLFQFCLFVFCLWCGMVSNLLLIFFNLEAECYCPCLIVSLFACDVVWCPTLDWFNININSKMHYEVMFIIREEAEMSRYM